jgi:hypothetical protein
MMCDAPRRTMLLFVALICYYILYNNYKIAISEENNRNQKTGVIP